MTKTTKPREPRPPGKWVRSKTGVYAKLVKTSQTTSDGLWYYRLRYEDGVVGQPCWTVAKLDAAGVRWLRRRPAAWGVV
jgi:hypothetical protein